MREDHVQFIIDHFELRGQKEYASIARQLAEENAKLLEQISLLERQLEDAYDEQRAMCERHEL